ncbi:MAG: DUF6498-containing protein [Pseudomonadota bacterium]
MTDLDAGTVTDAQRLMARPSVLFLISVNLIPLIGVTLFGWDVGFLMLLYWLETIVIGVFNIPKLITSIGERGTTPLWASMAGNLFLTAFFCVHYGGFNFGHYMFLQSFFDLPAINTEILIVLAGLSLSHVFSLIVNWFGKAEYKTAHVNEQMFKPYIRVVVMHVTIIFGGVFATMGGGFLTLALLVALKTGTDIAAHAATHGWVQWRSLTGSSG